MKPAHKLTIRHLDLINQYRQGKEPVNMPLPCERRPGFMVYFRSYMEHEKFMKQWKDLPPSNAVIVHVLKMSLKSKELKN